MSDKYTAVAVESLVDGERMMAAGTRKMTVKFPCLIKQVDRDTVEIEVECGPDPFNESYTKAVVEMLGVYGGEAFLDEMAAHMAKQVIIRSLR